MNLSVNLEGKYTGYIFHISKLLKHLSFMMKIKKGEIFKVILYLRGFLYSDVLFAILKPTIKQFNASYIYDLFLAKNTTKILNKRRENTLWIFTSF